MGAAAAGSVMMRSRLQLNFVAVLVTLCALYLHRTVWADDLTLQGEVINIDCGSSVSYVDGITNITWVPDAEYITTGVDADVPDAHTSYPGFSEFTTLRYFPDSRKKNCYSLPATPNNTYLIRATFFYGSYDNATTLPSFQMAIDQTVVSNVTFDNATIFTYREFSVASQATVIYLCLVRDNSSQSNPFVSAISLYPLPPYPETVLANLQDQRQYYQTKYRLSFGGQSTDLIRSPSDPFDRYWNPGGLAYVQGTTALQILNSTWANETVAVPENLYGLPPAAVLESAVSTTSNGSLIISLPDAIGAIGDMRNSSDNSTNTTTASPTIFLGLYFAELNSTANQFSRKFYVEVPGAAADSSNSSNPSAGSSNSSNPSSGSSNSPDPSAGSSNSSNSSDAPVYENPYNMSGGTFIASQQSWEFQLTNDTNNVNEDPTLFEIVLFPAIDSKPPLGPSLNALEFFERIDATATRTNDQDALAIEDIKSCMNLTEWTGDPCLPYPHPWLTCNSVNLTTSPSIIAVNLSGYDLNGTICRSFGNLSSLTSLLLGDNALMGPLPIELDNLTNLRTLQLQNNQLSGPLPDWLTLFPLLTQLWVQNNNFTGAIPVGLLYNNNLDFQYEPGNPSLTNTIATSPVINSTANSTRTGVIVGAVVGGNFAQAAVIILAVLYHQGKVSFNFLGFFKRIGCSLWHKTEDKLLDDQQMKDTEVGERANEHEHHVTHDVENMIHKTSRIQSAATTGVASNVGVVEAEGLATAKSFLATEAQELSTFHHDIPSLNNNHKDDPESIAAAAAISAAGFTTMAAAAQGYKAAGTAAASKSAADAAQGFRVAGTSAAAAAAASKGAADAAQGFTVAGAAASKGVLAAGKGLVVTEAAGLVASSKAGFASVLARAEKAPVLHEMMWATSRTGLGDLEQNIKEQAESSVKNFMMSGEQPVVQQVRSTFEAAAQHLDGSEEWRHVLSSLEDERKQAWDSLSKLQITKDETKQELMLFSKQMQDRQKLFQTANSKLEELRNEHNVETQQLNALLTMVSSRSNGEEEEEAEAEAVTAASEAAEALAHDPEAVTAASEAAEALAHDPEAVTAASEAAEALAHDPEAAAVVQSQISDFRTRLKTLQRKIDSQMGILDAFKDLLDTGESEGQKLNAKWQADNSTWLAASEWCQACDRHKAALSSQLQSMENGFQRPSLCPSPVAGFNFMNNVATEVDAAAAAGVVTATTATISSSSSSSSSAASSSTAAATVSSSSSTSEALSVSPCPFCNRGFKPAWAALVVSCEHAYHIWCAVTHFSSSTKCLHKDCQQEMHADFWLNSGIKMPSANAVANYAAALGAASDHGAHDQILHVANLNQHHIDQEAHINMQGFLHPTTMAANLEGMVETSISEIAEAEQLSSEIRATGSRIIKIINPLRQIVVFVIRIFRN